jgi:hypothetical protein
MLYFYRLSQYYPSLFFFLIILIIFTPNFVDNVVYTHRGGRKRSFRYLVLFVCFCLFNVAIGVE